MLSRRVAAESPGGGTRPGGSDGVPRLDASSRRGKTKDGDLLGPTNGSSCNGDSEVVSASRMNTKVSCWC